jgi:4'-phosphopantetheinyl transferase
MDQCTESEVQHLLPLVSAQRRDQALRYKHLHGRFCCLKSWMMLKGLLEQNGYNQTDLDLFLYNPQGKPYLANGPYFSISHCKAGIAVAVDDQPIGIDIESIRHADHELITRTMNADEQQHIHSDRDFTRFWTRKEAVVKAQGTGIESFEQLQNLFSGSEDHEGMRPGKIETIENENYIYSIAYGK